MKKYILIFENKIVYRYESYEPLVFGGPWQYGQSVEIPEEFDYLTVTLLDLGLE